MPTDDVPAFDPLHLLRRDTDDPHDRLDRQQKELAA